MVPVSLSCMREVVVVFARERKGGGRDGESVPDSFDRADDAGLSVGKGGRRRKRRVTLLC